MSIRNYIECDVYRPANSSGSPVEKSNSELQVIINGYTHKWITSCYVDYTEKSVTLDARLFIESYIFGKNNANISSSNIRTVTQVSTVSDFSTYTELTDNAAGGANVYNGTYSVCPRTPTGGIKQYAYEGAIFYNRGSTAPGSGTFYGYHTSRRYNLGATNRQIWIRVKVQWKNSSGTWVNCSRGTGLSVWKTYTTYAPFYPAITAPARFYANGLNRFTCNIKAELISEFTDAHAEGDTWIYFRPVRNEWSPYITTGTTTSYIYCYLQASVSDEYRASTYTFTLTLKVVDPSDPNVILTVGKRTMSGSVEYQAEDDTTQLYETPTWSVVDPTGKYTNYGVILANVMDTVGISFTARIRYGAWVYFKYILGIGYGRPFDITEESAGTVTVPVKDFLNYPSVEIGVGYSSNNQVSTNFIYSDKVTVPVIKYFMPSLPVTAIHRCDQDGSANDLGSYCRIDWAISVCPIDNKNKKTLVISHPQGSTTYNNNALASYTQGGSLIVAANTENAYTITFKLSDDLHTVTKTMRLSTANVTMDWLYNGQGVAFGKVASKENAVEIAEDWKLICYDLLFNNTDMSKWMQQIISRMDAIEQFAKNIGSTEQFQVTFYSRGTLLDRQWVKSGQDATDPITSGKIDTPTRNPTETEVYSFVGWAKTSTATSADSTALLNVTGTRSIYAIFSSQTRKYSVMWFNDSALLETDSDLSYHSNLASYGGDTPVRTGYTFGGWMPSGKYIESNENAMAQFYEDVEIEDSWEEILQAVDNGTAKSKYHMGNWKTLSTSEGDVPMRILYFNKDTFAGSKATAKITWLSKSYLWNHKIMNPAIQYTTSTQTISDWIRTSASGAYTYTSNTKRKRSSAYPGTVNLTVRCNGAGTLKIGYKYTGYNGLLIIKVNDEQVYSGHGESSTTLTYLEYSCAANQTFDIELIANNDSSAAYYIEEAATDIKKVEISCTGGLTVTSQAISTRIKTTLDEFVEGTGAIGGWKSSQLRSWLNGDFFNGIDPVVRNKIKSVNKCSLSYKKDATVDAKFSQVPNEITYDKVWVPSNSEVSGKFNGENQGVDFYMNPKLSSSGLGYWRRTAANTQLLVIASADETHELNRVSAPQRFGSTYHTVDNPNVSLYFGFCT